MAVGRTAGTEDDQAFITRVFDAMRGARPDADGVASCDQKFVFAQCHTPRALSDVVELFTLQVTVEHSLLSRWYTRLSKTLVLALVSTGPRLIEKFMN